MSEQVSEFKYSTAGLTMTERFEGLNLEAYQDPVGVWTIGYGHTGPDVVRGMEISREHADAILAADIRWAETVVNRAVKAPIKQNEFDAMVDFVFNLGAASFVTSTLLRLVNAGDFAGAAEQFLRWNKAGGEVLEGLTRRRAAERAMFLGQAQ
jgi:lysozyme